jgi:hypothetical protein
MSILEWLDGVHPSDGQGPCLWMASHRTQFDIPLGRGNCILEKLSDVLV